MNAIQWTRKALKQLRKLPPETARRIYRQVGALERFPDCRNVKRLKNHAHDYRLRVGRYRVFFNHDEDIRIISIEEVRKRDENTY